jgi:hypothetical protein
VGLGGGVHRNVVFFAQGADGFDVVVMVVRDENAQYLAEIDAHLPKLPAKQSGADARVYEYALHRIAEVIAITAAAAAKAQES